MIEFQPSEPEPEPGSGLSNLHLLPSNEHLERAYPTEFERVAQKETIAAIVESIEALTELRPGEKNPALYRRARTWNLEGLSVHLSRYGFFDSGMPGVSHARTLHEQELEQRVVGMELHYPATVNEAGDVEFPMEAYRIDKNTDGEHILKALTYDGDKEAEAADVFEKNAQELLELLQLLRGSSK